MPKNTTHHQGQLLKELVEWLNMSQQEFGDSIGLSRIWVRDSYKDERIIRKNLLNISRVHNVPLDYWEGKVALELVPTKASEPPGEYSSLNNPLQEKVNQLQNELYEAQKKIISLQEELLKYHIFPDTARN